MSSTTRTMIEAIVIGLIGGLFISVFKPEFFLKMAPYIGIGCIILMLITVFFGVGPENGSDDTAWLIIGGFYFQPSELVKIGFVITFATHLNIVKDNVNNFKNILLLCLHALIPVALVAQTGDDGSAILFLFIFMAMMFSAGVKYYYFLIGFVLVAIMFGAAWVLDLIPDFQKERFLVIPYPDRDPLGFAFQQNQSVTAIGSGMFFGQGYLKGPYTQSNAVPESQNDFIFSVAGEELGFLGCTVLIILLLAIIIRIISDGKKASTSFESYVCYGIAE